MLTGRLVHFIQEVDEIVFLPKNMGNMESMLVAQVIECLTNYNPFGPKKNNNNIYILLNPNLRQSFGMLIFL